MNDWSGDDALMAALGEAVAEADAVTGRRRAAAQAAFTWRSVDAELMELLHDSALDAGAAVRGAGDPGRLLSFGLGDLSLEVEVGAGELSGRLLPAQNATIMLQRVGADERTVAADGAGFFRFEAVESGPVRLMVTTSEHTSTTSWVSI